MGRFSPSTLLLTGLLLHALAAPASAEKASAERPEPWLHGPFAASAAELLEAAGQAPVFGDEPAQMIFQETRFNFDAEGRIVFRRHWIYRVLRAEGLRDWGISQVRWSPWHQERPRVSARSVGADGKEERFDDSAYTERPAPEGREDLIGGRRILEKKLPAQVGTVVEEEVVVRDRAPYFSGGTALRHYATLYIPILHGRLVLDAPTRLPLRFGVRRLPGIEPRRTVNGDRVELVFEYRDVAPATGVEVGIPGYRPRFPHIAFSTGQDWPAVAAVYRRRIDTSLADPILQELFATIPPPPRGLPRTELARHLLAALAARVSGSGLELGATSPLPTRLADALERGTGDGKDIATLFVGLARRHGLDAQLALLNSGFGPDIELKLPGLGLFNHAVVRLPPAGGNGAIWLDPSAPHARVDELPLPAQGRFALVIATGEIAITPVSKPADNRIEELREVFFADFGLGRIVERSEHFGSADRNARQIGEGMDAVTRRRGYQAYVQAMYQATSLGEVRETAAEDLAGPFTLRLEALGSGLVRTDFDQAKVTLPLKDLVRRLPNVFLGPGPPREEEFVFHEPFSTRWRYRIQPPAGFVPLALPAPIDESLGPGFVRARFRTEGGVVVGEVELDVGQRLLSPAQFDALREQATALAARPDLVVSFVHQTRVAVEQGKAMAALAELRAAVAADPGRPSHRARLARLLLDFGLVPAARRQAEEAVALSPSWAAAHFVHGQASSFDEVGREYSPWAELDTSKVAFARAMELDSGEPRYAAAASALERVLAARRPRESRGDLRDDDPQIPLRRLLLAHLAGEPAGLRLALHPRSLDLAGPAPAEKLLALLAPALEASPEAGPDRALDAWTTRLGPRINGSPHLGYRVALEGVGVRAYVARVDGALRLVGSSEDVALLGWEAWARLEAGDLEGAYRWLDWAAEEATAAPSADPAGRDPLGPRLVAAFWPYGDDKDEPGRKRAARRAAAFLAAPLDRAGRIAPQLEEALTEGGAEAALAFELARAAQQRAAGRLEGDAALGWQRRFPSSELAWTWAFETLEERADWAALREAAETRLVAAPGNKAAVAAWSTAAFWIDALPAAADFLAREAAARRLDVELQGRRAWLAIAIGDEASRRALSAELAALPPSAELLAWRAALAASLVQPSESRELLAQAADARPLAALRLDDACIIGLIAEALGLHDIARDAYTRLPSNGEPFSFAALGRRRLAQMRTSTEP